jgi:hypothetical protein
MKKKNPTPEKGIRKNEKEEEEEEEEEEKLCSNSYSKLLHNTHFTAIAPHPLHDHSSWVAPSYLQLTDLISGCDWVRCCVLIILISTATVNHITPMLSPRLWETLHC